MPRRRSRKKDESLFELLLDLPWQASVIVTLLLFALLRWVIPNTLPQSPVLRPLINLVTSIAPFALLFLIPGLISFIKQSRNKVSSLKVEPNYAPATYSGEIAYRANTNPNMDDVSTSVAASSKSKPLQWSLELLKELEWKRFELVCAEYFKLLGKRVETIAHGADGGIDARIYGNYEDRLEYAMQCKSWGSTVGVKHIRELFGVMAHESAGKGIFMITNDFTVDAKQFAEEHKDKLFLIDGEKFISMVKKLPAATQAKLLQFATDGDYITPTCASCGVKLIQRSGKSGLFWGCRNYPRCKTTMKIS